MKRLFGCLLILCIFYMIVQLGFRYFGDGHTVNYEIKGNDHTIKVIETANFRRKNEIDHYQFTFKINGKEFVVQTYETFQKDDHVVKNIEYFKNNNYECIYPIFKNKEQITDILCEHQNIIYNYHDLQGNSGELDKFAKDMKKNGYDETHWINNMDKTVKDNDGPIVVYPDNLVREHYIGVDNYSGIYLVNNYEENKNLYKISIFVNDVYERPIEERAGRFYVVANYTSKYDFDSFNIVDLVYNDKKDIRYHSKISFNSYIQGVVDNAIYLFDREAKKQYKIDAKAETIVEIGNEETGIKYYNLGTWENRNVVDAVNTNLYFKESETPIVNGYERVDKVGTDLSGYYYYYKKVKDQYEVYRAHVQNTNSLMYLFTTSNINEVKYMRDYVYYKDGEYIKYYHDMTGSRTIISNTEFAFNKSLKFYLYYQKD